MNINIKSNSLYKELTNNLDLKENNDFNISELVNSYVLKLNIKKININNNSVVTINNLDEKFYKNINDLSLFEWNNNKIFLGFKDKYFTPTIILGKKIFDLYSKELSENFKHDKFILSLSIDYGKYKNIIIRFHKSRAGEIPILLNDLENYKTNGMLVAYIN